MQALVSAAGGLGMVIPLIAVGAVFALGALWDAFRAKHASERVMAAVAVTWLALWASLLLTPPPVWEAWVGYDRLAAILSSTSAGGVPFFAFSYTLVFAGFTLYVLRPVRLGAAEPNGNGSRSPHVFTWCRGAAFLAGFAGILHFATGTFGG